MTFYARPSVYRIDRAPTSRGKCRKCKQPIQKGHLRVAITAFVRPNRATCLLRCASCACLPAFAAAIRAVYGSAARVPGEAATELRAQLQGAMEGAAEAQATSPRLLSLSS